MNNRAPTLQNLPLTTMLTEEANAAWFRDRFHFGQLTCAHCGASHQTSYVFRATSRSCLTVFRCRHCYGIYNLYTGTIFEGRHLRPSQVIQLIDGVKHGKSAVWLASTLKISRTTSSELRRLLLDEIQS